VAKGAERLPEIPAADERIARRDPVAASARGVLRFEKTLGRLLEACQRLRPVLTGEVGAPEEMPGLGGEVRRRRGRVGACVEERLGALVLALRDVQFGQGELDPPARRGISAVVQAARASSSRANASCACPMSALQRASARSCAGSGRLMRPSRTAACSALPARRSSAAQAARKSGAGASIPAATSAHSARAPSHANRRCALSA